MRVTICLLLISLCVSAQSAKPSKLFPIPSSMQEYWRGADLSETEQKLLNVAIAADLTDLEKNCEDKYKSTPDTVDMAGASLGKLGKGIFVRMSGSCMCGATGNCPIYVYVREKDKYRAALSDDSQQPDGWSFGVVTSKSLIPDIILASNPGGGMVALTLYRYLGNKYVLRACETLTKKDGAEEKSWWDPTAVLVRPCASN